MSDTDVSVLDVRNLKSVFQALRQATRDVKSERLISQPDAPLYASPRTVAFPFHPAGDVLSHNWFPSNSPFQCAVRARSTSTGKSELKTRKIEAVGFIAPHRRAFGNAAVSTSSSGNQH